MPIAWDLAAEPWRRSHVTVFLTSVRLFLGDVSTTPRVLFADGHLLLTFP